MANKRRKQKARPARPKARPGGASVAALLKAVTERPLTPEIEAELRSWAERLLDYAGRPRILTEMQALLPPPTEPIRSPEQVLVERLLLAINLAQWGLGRPVLLPVEVWEGGMEPHLLALSTALMLTEAVPYLWTNETRMAVQQMAERATAPLPSHVLTRDAVPVPVMWWTWETEWSAPDDPSLAQQGMLVHPAPVPPGSDGVSRMGLAVTEIDMGPPGLVVRSGMLGLFGDCYPEDLGDRPAYAEIMRFLAFLNSPYIPKDEATVSRRAQRWTERAGVPELLEGGVRFLVLRREPHDEDAGEAADRQYHHRWLVSGHFRNQFYPSQGSHKVIWIAPYVKGPAGAPMKTQVFRVSR